VATITSIAVTPNAASIPLNSHQRFIATGTFSNGDTQNLGSNVTWTSSDESVATIDSGGVANAYNRGNTTIEASFGSIAGSTTLDITAPRFIRVGSLKTSRGGHTATLLNNGKVLIVGGQGGYLTTQPTAELYDPATGTFSFTNSMSEDHFSHSATSLANGSVLIAGGSCSQCPVTDPLWAETYNPVTQAFTAVGSLSMARSFHTATLLNDGTVLFVGGYSSGLLTSAEVFDPATDTFVAAGGMTKGRAGHTATLLPDGSVLIVGGGAAAAELYTTTPPAPASLQVTPSAATLLIGESRQFTVVDNNGYPREDVNWSVSDPTVATIDTESTVTLTAVTAGTVTLTATIGGVTGDVVVTVLATPTFATGAVRWSIEPSLPGYTPLQVVQAQADSFWKPAFYHLSTDGVNTLVQAVTIDGRQLWQRQMAVANANSTPDAYGGLIVTEYNTCDNVHPMKISALDAATGEWVWSTSGASTCTADAPQFGIRHDGSVVVVAPGNTSGCRRS
jgi:hypothetical protein